MIRRKFIKAATVAGSTLVSLPVLGANTCTVSGAMSGNMSDARPDACEAYRGAHTPRAWFEIPNSVAYTYSQIDYDTGLFEETFGFGPDVQGMPRDGIAFKQALGWAVDATSFSEMSLAGQAATTFLNAKHAEYELGAHLYPYTPSEAIDLYNTYQNTQPELLFHVLYELNIWRN